MPVIHTKKELKSHLSALIAKKYSLGLVPTMGALHEGHLSLIKKAIFENDATVVSIFINPTQFNSKDDLKKYPNTREADLKILSMVSKDLIVFIPSVSEMYSNEIKSKTYNFSDLDSRMEGEYRSSHFDGVATIVEALLGLIMPDKAYFGEKDFQQLQIIKKLVALKKFPIEIIGCPIVRESNGLAMSSRNERLPKKIREEAAVIFKTLQAAKEVFALNSAKYVKNWVALQFDGFPHFKLEYIEITDEDLLRPVLRKRKGSKYRMFIAVYTGGIRLIDNIALN